MEFGVNGNPFDPQTMSAQVLESSERLARLISEIAIIQLGMHISFLFSLQYVPDD